MKMNRVLKLGVLAFCVGGVAIAVRKFIQHESRNHITVEIRESVTLPPTSTASFTELSLAVVGEVSVRCEMLQRCKFCLRLSPPTRQDQASLLSSAAVSDMVDRSELEEKGYLQFSPACIGKHLLMTYHTCPGENFWTPITVKDCILRPASVPDSFSLSLEMQAFDSVSDVAFAFVFPKYTVILSVDTEDKGTVENQTDTELVWHLGDVNPPLNGDARNTTARIAATDATLNELPSASDQLNSVMGSGNHKDFHFVVTFSVADSALSRTLSSSRPPSSSSTGKKARSNKNLQTKTSSYEDIMPGVSLSFSTQQTASGITVRKLSVVDSGVAGRCGDSSNMQPAHRIKSAFRCELSRWVRYRTHFAQPIQVTAQL